MTTAAHSISIDCLGILMDSMTAMGVAIALIVAGAEAREFIDFIASPPSSSSSLARSAWTDSDAGWLARKRRDHRRWRHHHHGRRHETAMRVVGDIWSQPLFLL